VWADRIERGLVAITTLTLPEGGFSARSAGDLVRARFTALASMPMEYVTPAAEDRAVQVQRPLAERQHRAPPSIPDLGYSRGGRAQPAHVLHLDRDFDLTADLTGQPMERLRIAVDSRAIEADPLHSPQWCATVRR
jgi:hypothetical protein